MLDPVTTEQHMMISFKKWVNEHHDGPYTFVDPINCAFAQFLKEQGYPNATVGFNAYRLDIDDPSTVMHMSDGVARAIFAKDERSEHTFEGLRDRVNALSEYELIDTSY